MIGFSFFNLNDYIGILIIFFVSSLLAFILIVLSYFLVNQVPDSEKLSVYECGFEPYDNSRNIFNIHFYLVALFFVIFDIEMLYLIPWSLAVLKINVLSFWSTIDFVFELGIGFFYIWYSNSLNW